MQFTKFSTVFIAVANTAQALSLCNGYCGQWVYFPFSPSWLVVSSSHSRQRVDSSVPANRNVDATRFRGLEVNAPVAGGITCNCLFEYLAPPAGAYVYSPAATLIAGPATGSIAGTVSSEGYSCYKYTPPPTASPTASPTVSSTASKSAKAKASKRA